MVSLGVDFCLSKLIAQAERKEREREREGFWEETKCEKVLLYCYWEMLYLYISPPLYMQVFFFFFILHINKHFGPKMKS